MSVDKGVRLLYRKYETLGQPGYPDLSVMDRAQWLGSSFPMTYETLPRAVKRARELDQPVLDRLRKVGYRLTDGPHGGGALALAVFYMGGYYWETGCCRADCLTRRSSLSILKSITLQRRESF